MRGRKEGRRGEGPAGRADSVAAPTTPLTGGLRTTATHSSAASQLARVAGAAGAGRPPPWEGAGRRPGGAPPALPAAPGPPRECAYLPDSPPPLQCKVPRGGCAPSPWTAGTALRFCRLPEPGWEEPRESSEEGTLVCPKLGGKTTAHPSSLQFLPCERKKGKVSFKHPTSVEFWILRSACSWMRLLDSSKIL